MRGYPTIKMFPSGKKDGDVVEYDGGRKAPDIVSWSKDKLAANIPPPEVVQVNQITVQWSPNGTANVQCASCVFQELSSTLYWSD